MKKGFEYKGFYGSAEISVEDDCLFGKIEFIDDLVSYEADTPKGLEKAFQEAVDDHIATREKLGWEVHKSASGTFNVRVGPELHRAALIRAKLAGVSLNEVVKTSLNNYLEKALPTKALTPSFGHDYEFEYEGFWTFIQKFIEFNADREATLLSAKAGDTSELIDLAPFAVRKGIIKWGN